MQWTDIHHASCPCDYNYALCGIDISEIEFIGDYRFLIVQNLCKPCVIRLLLPCLLCGELREENMVYYEGEANQRGTLVLNLARPC